LDEISRALDKTPIDSRDGLVRIVKLLVQRKIVTEEESKMLEALIDAIYSSLDSMANKVDSIYKDARKTAGDLVVAIVSIARSSIEWVQKNSEKVDGVKATYIVSSDVLGALSGAALGAVFGPITTVLGALAGAAAGSARAALGSK
jgi:hypothetical protein